MMVILTIDARYGDVKGPKSVHTRVFNWDTSGYMQQGSIIRIRRDLMNLVPRFLFRVMVILLLLGAKEQCQ